MEPHSHVTRLILAVGEDRVVGTGRARRSAGCVAFSQQPGLAPWFPSARAGGTCSRELQSSIHLQT